VNQSAAALVIVPTYNERDNIEELIDRLLNSAHGDVHLLIVDDSSPDGTARVAADALTKTDRATILQRPHKDGLASAYVTGFRWGLERGYRSIVEMDADLSHDPAAVSELLAQLDGADLVIGSRYVPGGSVINWGRGRRWLSRAGNLYARLWLGWDVKDATSGYRAYRAAALAAQDLSSVRSDGYAFQIEMTYRMHLAGCRIEEVPITFTERRAGRSKLSRAVVLEALWRVPWWALKYRRRRTRRTAA
jgi:dolichol-phosphate mannosyltransferase